MALGVLVLGVRVFKPKFLLVCFFSPFNLVLGLQCQGGPKFISGLCASLRGSIFAFSNVKAWFKK